MPAARFAIGKCHRDQYKQEILAIHQGRKHQRMRNWCRGPDLNRQAN